MTKKLIEVALPLEAINAESTRIVSADKCGYDVESLLPPELRGNASPFRIHPDFAATSVTYDIVELIKSAEIVLTRGQEKKS